MGKIKMTVNPFIKRAAASLNGLLTSIIEPTLRILGVSAILFAAWYAFLLLAPKPPIDATPVLIMIWSSVFILLFTLFPRILDRIKKLKVKDFEIELQDTVNRTISEDYISLSHLDEYTFSQKGDFRNLEEILEQSIRHPSKPTLLVANLRDGEYISIPMLFIYLFFLDLISKSVTVLFISTKQRLRDITDIAQDSIVGVVSGKIVLQVFYRRFPRFFRIFDLHGSKDFPFEFEEFFRRGRFRGEPSEFFFRRFLDSLRENQNNNGREFLTEQDVRSWFRGELSFRAVDVSLGSRDLKMIREALAQEDEFILLISGKCLRSVASICYFSKDLSKKVLAEITQSR